MHTGCGPTDDGPMKTPIDDVEFPDDALQRCWEFEMNGDFAEDQLTLDCDRRGIESLEGIDVLSGLVTLDLQGNDGIAGLELLPNLPNLENLYLGEADITNDELQIIASITTLVDLELFGNNLGDIAALANLINIDRLLLAASGITGGADALIALPNVSTISLGGNPESPCSDLEQLIAAFPEQDIAPNPPLIDIDCRGVSEVTVRYWRTAE